MPNEKQLGLLNHLIRSTRLPRHSGWSILQIEFSAKRMPEDEFSYLIDDLQTYDRTYAENYLGQIKKRVDKYLNICDSCKGRLTAIESYVNAERSVVDKQLENFCSVCAYSKQQ